MTLKPARFRTLRRFYCWFLGQHDFRAVRRSWFEDRYGKTGVTPEPGKFTYEEPPTWIEAPNGALACMTCGRLKDWLYVCPGTMPDAPVWIPPRYRHKPTCPLCLHRSFDYVFARCEAWLGLDSGSHSPTNYNLGITTMGCTPGIRLM